MSAPVDLQSNDFELFQVPPRFSQDASELRATWRALQAKAHPDQFASSGESAKRLALQWSVRINEAYDRLKNPLSRAAYLCALRGSPVQAENNTAMPTAFLMQQMEWRETLEEAQDTLELETLIAELQQAHKQYLNSLATLLDTADESARSDTLQPDSNTTQATEKVRALMFIEKVLAEAERKLDTLQE